LSSLYSDASLTMEGIRSRWRCFAVDLEFSAHLTGGSD